MPISITIRQKGLFASQKKTLPLDVILGDELEYGAYTKDDKDRLTFHKLGTREFIAVVPHAVGRGIWVLWKETEVQKVRLLLPTPCHNEEITALFDMLQRIRTYWNCTATLDDPKRRITDKNSERVCLEVRKYNRQALHDLINLTAQAKGGLRIQCSRWPITITSEMSSTFLQTPTTFDKWLHNKLVIDAYYSRPDYYQFEDGSIEGEYTLLNDKYLILPYEPFDVAGETFTKTGQQVSADRYTMYLFTEKAGDIIGILPYDIFLNVLDPKKIHEYDGKCFLYEPLSCEEIEALYENGKGMMDEIAEEGEED